MYCTGKRLGDLEKSDDKTRIVKSAAAEAERFFPLARVKLNNCKKMQINYIIDETLPVDICPRLSVLMPPVVILVLL